MPKTDGLGAEIGPHQRPAPGRRVAFVEDEIDDGQYRVQPRMRSMALCRAAWMIHARGNSGIPEDRHWSTAAVKASCATSSARSKSPKSRISAATMRPQSER